MGALGTLIPPPWQETWIWFVGDPQDPLLFARDRMRVHTFLHEQVSIIHGAVNRVCGSGLLVGLRDSASKGSFESLSYEVVFHKLGDDMEVL